MEIRKCVQCGGNLERLRIQRAWRCPYCGVRYEDEAQEPKSPPAEYYGLNEEIFSVEKDLSKIMKKDGGAGCIRSIVKCMSTFETAGQVEEYLLKKLSPLSVGSPLRPSRPPGVVRLSARKKRGKLQSCFL